MNQFTLFAQPWWVNLLILVPVSLFFLLRKNKLTITKQQLAVAAVFAIAFGFVEAAVVIYLRAALGLLPGFMGNLGDVARQATGNYEQIQFLNSLPKSLFTVEFFRNAATIIMLASVALISAKKFRERAAMFLWMFAFWDIFYYVFLCLTVRWPSSLTTPDVLFLIPVPWLAQVWFPLLVSGLTIVTIFINRED